ncbi:MAG: DUF1573 domain-containing protein [Thermonemataceae bacterium]|nr:DUF1573 domain-containing protein [Thermonemataceae bacterium]
MKKNKPFGMPFGILMMLLLAFGANAQKTPDITFEETVHDFGKIEQGKPVTVVFNFKNTGKAPLAISDVKASCGCTTPSYTKEPIGPKKKGSVTATFNAAGLGDFNKTVTVNTNAGGPIMLTLKGTVVAKTETTGK